MKNATSSDSQFGVIWSQCVARAWQDVEFREALKRDPSGTLLASYQFSIPQGVNLEVVESQELSQGASANCLRMVIPPQPAMELSEIAVASPEGDSGSAPFSLC